MAVGRLSGAWVRQVLTEVFPAGVVRRDLLDHFAAVLVSKRSSKGAKGRLARRLYGTLVKLQRRGLVSQEAGVVRSLAVAAKARGEAPPALGVVLERLLFKALLAEDGQGEGHTPRTLVEARRTFLAEAITAGWATEAAAALLGLTGTQAGQVLEGW
ncbi:MAG: hypothetical protein WCL47_06590 [Holophagaceae bacterium]